MAKEHIRLVKNIFADKNLPQEAYTIKHKAFSSAYYMAGVKSTILNSWKYYLAAFFLSPPTLFGKMRYELVKAKKKLT